MRDDILSRLEKLRGTNVVPSDSYGHPQVATVRVADLDAAINDIRAILDAEPPLSYLNACILSRVFNDSVRMLPTNSINKWLKYQIATRREAPSNES